MCELISEGTGKDATNLDDECLLGALLIYAQYLHNVHKKDIRRFEKYLFVVGTLEREMRKIRIACGDALDTCEKAMLTKENDSAEECKDD